MKKIACISALACVLAVSAGPAMARSTVSLGYAQSDMQGVVNKANGFNLKYRWEDQNNPLGWIGSFTYTTKNHDVNGFNDKGQYYGITGGPAYRINDWASLYGVVGIGFGKFNSNAINTRDKSSTSDVGFSYGAGMQFNPMENVAIDTGYERSRIRSVDIGTWIVGVGYSF